jgi:hypothetical protein
METNNRKQLVTQDNGNIEKIFPKNYMSNIVDEETGESLRIFLLKYNHIDLGYRSSKSSARLAVPIIMRRKGLYITYYLPDDVVITELFNGNKTEVSDTNWVKDELWVKDVNELNVYDVKISDGSITLDKLSEEVMQLISSKGDITINNFPDNEDLELYTIYQDSNNKIDAIRFKDRDNSNGMAYKYLRKTKNMILSQSDFNQVNTIYEIRYDFDLDGKIINIPENCELKFVGGSLKNGTIVFSNTIIKYKNSYIFDDIDISGNVCNDLYLSMWKIDNTIDVAPIIEQGLYSLSNYRFNIDIDCYISSYASIPSNSDLYINHDITITSSGDGGFTLMNRGSSVYKYSGASNIIVHGGGTFDFNSRNTNSSTNSAFTIYHCSNVIIDGITFKDPASYHVIEIGGSEHITIKNCKFFGFRPIANEALPELAIKGECIQIEHTKSGNGGIPVPYFDKVECRDIIIKDNLFDGLYTYDSNGNKVYSTYMWRPIGSHDDHVGSDADLTYHDGLLIEGNTFNSIRQVCITPRYINNCSIINNKATDLQGMFVSGLPVSQTFYNISFDFNNVRIIGNVIKFDKTVTTNTLVSSVYTVGRNNWGAIDLIGNNGNAIIDNEIYDAPNSSIILNCCPNTLIINNKFYGWNTIDKNKGVASNNRAAIDITDDTPAEGNNQVKEITQYISMSGNLFVDNWTEFPIRPFTRNKSEIEDSWNIIDNIFNISNPAWRFIPPTTVNALDITSFGSVLVDDHPVWNKGFIGKSFTRSTGKNIYFNGKQWLNEDGTFIYAVSLVSNISDFTKTNHIYKIVDHIDLQGETLTMPANCTLDFQGGSFSNGTIIGSNTKIKAGLQKIFNTDITLSGTWIADSLSPEHFGIIGIDATQDTTYIQKALDCCSAINIKTVKLQNKTYQISSSLLIQSNIKLEGAASRVWNNGSATILSLAENVVGITVESTGVEINDLKITGNTTNTGISFTNRSYYFSGNRIITAGLGIGFDIQSSWTYIFNLCRIEGGIIGFKIQEGTSGTFNSCVAFSCTEYGFYVTKLNYGSFNGCGTDGCKYGFYFTDACRGVTLSSCGCENTQVGGYMVKCGARAYVTITGFSVGTMANVDCDLFIFEADCRVSLIDLNVGSLYHPTGNTLNVASGAAVALINCYLTGTSVGLENCSVISPYGNTLKYSTTVDKINTKELVTSSLATNATYTVLPTAPLNSVYLITAVTNGNSAARGLAIVTIPTDYGMATVDNLVANANCQISIDATGNIIVTNTSSSAKAYKVSLLKLI